MNKVPFPLAAFQERKEEALWAQTERWIIHGPSSGAPLCSFLLPRTYIWKETWSWGLSRRGASTPCLELVERCCPEGPKASEAMGPRLPTTRGPGSDPYRAELGKEIEQGESGGEGSPPWHIGVDLTGARWHQPPPSAPAATGERVAAWAGGLITCISERE